MKKIDMHMILLFYKKINDKSDYGKMTIIGFFCMERTKERIFRKINYINVSKVL